MLTATDGTGSTSPDKKVPICKECKEKHHAPGEGYCTKCKACLYMNGKQIPDDVYPFFECLKCGQTNFWD